MSHLHCLRRRLCTISNQGRTRTWQHNKINVNERLLLRTLSLLRNCAEHHSTGDHRLADWYYDACCTPMERNVYAAVFIIVVLCNSTAGDGIGASLGAAGQHLVGGHQPRLANWTSCCELGMYLPAEKCREQAWFRGLVRRAGAITSASQLRAVFGRQVFSPQPVRQAPDCFRNPKLESTAAYEGDAASRFMRCSPGSRQQGSAAAASCTRSTARRAL